MKLAGHVPSAGTRPPGPLDPLSRRRRIFLLSPANASGVRASWILGDSARSCLAERLRGEGAPLGEVFSFISGLYFRGKLAYARAYADPPPGTPGVMVITASGGLVSPDTLFTINELRDISAVPIEAEEPRYRIPLERDAQLLCDHLGSDCEVVLLGSIATPKYVRPLVSVFGDRLVFPAEFVGRGDMSRGGLMLRCEREGIQLTYVPAVEAVYIGSRPPKLPNADNRSKRAAHRSRS
jgi:hypothetical protein